MEKHLAEEEELYPRVCKEVGLTKEQSQELTTKILGAIPMNVMSKGFPMMLYSAHRWMDHKRLSDYFDPKLPCPIKFLVNNFWIPAFFNECLARLEALKYGAPFEPNRGCSASCGSACVLM